MRFLSYIISKITKREHKFTIQWCLCIDNKRIQKSFAIASVGVYYKDDIHNKRLINKSLNPDKYIKEMVQKKEIPKDCELSYNIISYYGYMKR